MTLVAALKNGAGISELGPCRPDIVCRESQEGDEPMSEDVIRGTPVSGEEIKKILAMPQPKGRLYFQLDTQTVDALELVLEHLQRVPDRPMSWKWVVIGLHAALQGSFGLVLRRTDGAQLLIHRQEQEFWERANRERETGEPEPPIPNPRIDTFLDLFAKTQEARRMQYLGGVPLKPTPNQVQSVNDLNGFRNHLIHFSDTILVSEAAWLLDDVMHGIAIVDTLLTKTQRMEPGLSYGPIDTIVDHEQADRARALITAIRAEIIQARERYGVLE